MVALEGKVQEVDVKVKFWCNDEVYTDAQIKQDFHPHTGNTIMYVDAVWLLALQHRIRVWSTDSRRERRLQ